MAEEKGMSKLIFTVFVIVLLAFLFFHFYKVNNIEKQYQATMKTITAQLKEASKEIVSLKGEVDVLKLKLEIASIINEVAKNNFGIAEDKINALVSKLEAKKHKNIDEIKKLKEQIDILFTKKDNNQIIEALGKLQKVIEQQ